MVLKKLVLNEAHYMNERELKLTKGGVTLEEYCKTLCIVAQGSGSGWSDGAWEGAFYGKHLCLEGGISWPPC